MNKSKHILISAAALLGLASTASAQGLLALNDNDRGLDTKVPFHWTVGLSAGYDSNQRTASGDGGDSVFLSAHIGAEYATGDRRTSYLVKGDYSPVYYLDAPAEGDDLYHNVRLSFNVRHRANNRLTISNSAYISYEVEPNYAVGASIARRTEQYLYWYNSLSAAYSWTRRFSTVFSYSIAGISYDDSASAAEDYINHLFGFEARYALSRTTTLASTYRYGITEYENGFGDSKSHYFLVGVDQKFSPRLTGSVRGGVELQERDNGGDNSAPYFEGNLTYFVKRNTHLGWYHRLGYESSDIGGYQDRYSYRTGLTLQQKLNNRLSGNLGAHYIFDQFAEGTGDLRDFDDHIFAISAGLNYNIYKNVSLNTSYSFTSVNSDSAFRDYERHMVSMGVSARF